MIRRFNYTNRIRIDRKDIRITLKQQDGENWFDADLAKLSGYRLPPDSLVFLEAYRQTHWMRFSYGKVGELRPDPNRSLVQFDSPEGIRFRVKITPAGDTHKLLAVGDGIPLHRLNDSVGERVHLLPVKPQKLGDEIFRVDYSGELPLLLVNSDVGNYRDIARWPVFMALVYPTIFREILTRIVVFDKYDSDDGDPDNWRSQWLRFATTQLPGIGPVPSVEDDDERGDWVDEAVATFAKLIQARGKFTMSWKEES